MAAFASCRRAGWVRFLVVLLCALFLFASLGAPAARAEALTVGLFTAAAVLSAATAALGFKLANSADGQATLAKMVQDFKVASTAVGLVLVGSKINGLIDGVDYIKMQVKAGKTYLDERVVAWVQQWLGNNGVYDTGGLSFDGVVGNPLLFNSSSLDSVLSVMSHYPCDTSFFRNIVSHYNLNLSNKLFLLESGVRSDGKRYQSIYYFNYYNGTTANVLEYSTSDHGYYYVTLQKSVADVTSYGYNLDTDTYYKNHFLNTLVPVTPRVSDSNVVSYVQLSNYGNVGYTAGTSGFSGADTIGKDVVDKTLDETLAGLKEWAPDWWDAGADSSTNGAAAGTKDLPLNMGSDVKTVTGNPALEVDQPLIYTPWFEETLDNLRSGETAGTVTNTATSAADMADKAEAAQGTVEDAQGVVQSLISWGLDYISPDKGLFSRFPLCIPYDAYLLVTAALGVDAQDLGEIVGQSPGEVSAQIDDGVAVQSDFVPVISVKHDWTQDGATIPVEVTIDLRPYDGIIKMIRTLVSVYVIAELIASEYKRIRGS